MPVDLTAECRWTVDLGMEMREACHEAGQYSSDPSKYSQNAGPGDGFDSDRSRILWQIGSECSLSHSKVQSTAATRHRERPPGLLRPMLKGRCLRKLSLSRAHNQPIGVP
jgi:hypothetical protein